MRAALRVLVVGSGIAGLTAARVAHDAGHEVTLVTKLGISVGCTERAQGGIAGAVFAGDSPALHVRDTLAAGAGECDVEAVRVLCEEGPARIHELAAIGVEFDRGADGGWAQGLEAAHSVSRVVHAGGDATGARIEAALIAAVRQRGLRVLEHTELVRLVVRDGRVAGAVLRSAHGLHELDADAVILATGGSGALYPRTSNPASATGDGIAVAARAGAAVADLEFVQFHPTVLATGEPFLVSEAVRGAGATLIDAAGERFMLDVDPRAELAPRDVVARACADAMIRQGGTPVFLDARGFDAAWLAERFPTIDAAVRERGLDWSREPVPVQPGAHFVMGGIATDLDGRTNLPGLYAVGEVACTGVHGANRLASNSLLEGAVFGARAAAALGPDAARQDAASDGAWSPELRSPVLAGGLDAAWAEAGAIAAAAADPAAPWSPAALRQLMWRRVGLRRNRAGLEEAAAQLVRWRDEPGVTDAAADGADAAHAASLLDVALLTCISALRRPHSVGAHFRDDDLATITAPLVALTATV